MKRLSIIFTLWSMAPLVLMGQAADQSIQTGNDLYRQQKYDQAAAQYNKAIILESSNTTATFNLANTLYRIGKQDEAIKTLTDLPGNTKDKELRSKAYYNKGVIFSQQKKLEESIEAYKNALRQNPNDSEARENLQKALLELKKKNPPKKEKDQDKKKKKDQQQQPQKQPKMSPKEAEQRLKLLEQKEKEVQQRIQNEKAKTGGGQGKDW